MKKLSFLFVAFALISFISLNACKSSTTAEEAEAAAEDLMEELTDALEEVAADTAVVDTAAVEEVVEEVE